MIDLTPIVNTVITLLAMLITTFLIPWIQTKATNEKLGQIEKWTKIAVEAAEMIYTESGMGEAKKAYVTNYLKKKGYDLDVDTVDALIESVVHQLNLIQKPFRPVQFVLPNIPDDMEEDMAEGESEDV